MSIFSEFVKEKKDSWNAKAAEGLKKAEEAHAANKKGKEPRKIITAQEWIENGIQATIDLSKDGLPHCRRAMYVGKYTEPYSKQALANDLFPVKANNGYIYTSNIDCDIDILGAAVYAGINQMLCLKLEDGKMVCDHLYSKSDKIKKDLEEIGADANAIFTLFEKFSYNTTSDGTSSLLKQIYFPIDTGKEEYQLITPIISSGAIFALKKTVNKINMLNNYIEYDNTYLYEKYDITPPENIEKTQQHRKVINTVSILYGGAQPQNISIQNNNNRLPFCLLKTMPPAADKSAIRRPRYNFFKEDLKFKDFRDYGTHLFDLINAEYTNANIKAGILFSIEDMVEKMFVIAKKLRKIKPGWTEKISALPEYQKIWLDEAYKEKRQDNKELQENLAQDMTSWIDLVLKKVSKNSKKIDDQVFSMIRYAIIDILKKRGSDQN